MSVFLNNLSKYCFASFDYVDQLYENKNKELLEVEEKCKYYIANADKSTEVYVPKESSKLGSLKANVMRLASEALLGGAFTPISLLLKKVRPQKCVDLNPSFNSSKFLKYSNSAYFEVTRRIKNLDQLEKILDSLPDKELEINQLIEKLNSQNWDFKNKDYPYYFLLALRENRISSHQFGTIMRYYSTTVYHKKEEIQILSLFNADGTKNPLAYQYIKQTLKLHHSGLITDFACVKNEEPLMSDDEFDLLFEKMKDLPPSEQQIFIIPDIYKESPLSNPSITLAVRNNTAINIFNRFEIEYSQKRMIPSIGLLQTFVKVLYPDSYVQVNPVIGLSSLDDIRQNGLDATRDVAVSFPWVSLPNSADRYKSPYEYDFSGHDDYHVIITSAIPHECKKQTIRISDIIQKYMKDHSLESNSSLKEFRAMFIDMELFLFRREFRKENNADKLEDIPRVFWKSIIKVFASHERNNYVPKIKYSQEKDILKLIIEEMVSPFLKEEIGLRRVVQANRDDPRIQVIEELLNESFWKSGIKGNNIITLYNYSTTV